MVVWKYINYYNGDSVITHTIVYSVSKLIRIDCQIRATIVEIKIKI